MRKKKFKDTKVGSFLKAKAPHILDIVGDIVPGAGIKVALKIAGKIIEKDEKVDNDTKLEAKNLINLEVFNETFKSPENMKDVFTSKKFWYAVAGVIAVIIVSKLNLPAETVQDAVYTVSAIIVALITGQGLADLGKEKAKIE